MSKYKGIDSRQIKCVSDNPNSIEAGISFDEDENRAILRFHFLTMTKIKGWKTFLNQETKIMYLSNETIDELIEQLKELKK